MRRLYWRPSRVSFRVLFMVAVVAVAGLVSVETFRVKERQPYYKQKVKAARLTKEAFSVIKEERLKLRRYPIDPEADPAATGLIGVLLSPVTTNTGYLPAKQTSANPNFAAVLVHLLKRAGVEEGDNVAVGFSGSFPAINVSVLAALETLKARPIVISSVGASQWGANVPKLSWLDMEALLVDRGLLRTRSVGATRGGVDDRGLGLSKHGRKALDETMERVQVSSLDAKNTEDSLEKRMTLYREHAGDRPIKAYVNVGGGTTSVGTKVGKRMFRPGLNRSLPTGAGGIDSVMTRFSAEGVPVIHMSKINAIAERYGLPLHPTTLRPVGEGLVFERDAYQPALAVAVLVLIVVLLFAFVRLDWGYRIFSAGRRDSAPVRPERMV